MCLWIGKELAEEFCTLLLYLGVGQDLIDHAGHVDFHTVFYWGGRFNVMPWIKIALLFNIELPS